MRHKLTQKEINRRMAEIKSMPPEEITPDEEVALAKAEAMDDGTVLTIEEYKKQLEV